MGGLVETPYTKQPWDQRTLRFDFEDDCQPLLDDGYAYSTLAVAIFDSAGADQSSSMIQGTPSRTNNHVFVTVKAGTDGSDYYGRIRLTLTKTAYDSQQIEADFLIQVREKGK